MTIDDFRFVLNDPIYLALFATVAAASGIIASDVDIQRAYSYFKNYWLPREINSGSQQIYSDLVNAKNEFLSAIGTAKNFTKNVLTSYFPDQAYTGYPIKDMYNYLRNLTLQAHKNDVMKKLGFEYVDNTQLHYPDNFTTAPPTQWNFTHSITLDGFLTVEYCPAEVDVKYTSEAGDITVQNLASHFGVEQIIYVTCADLYLDDGDCPEWDADDYLIMSGTAPNGKSTLLVTPGAARALLGEYTGQFLRNLGISASDVGTDFLNALSISTLGIPYNQAGQKTLFDILNPTVHLSEEAVGDVSQDYTKVFPNLSDQIYISSFAVSGGGDYGGILEQIRSNTEYIKTQIDASAVQVSQKFTNIENLVTDVKTKVDTMSGKVDTMSSKVDTMSSKVDTMSSKVDTVTGKVDTMDETLQEVKTEAQEGTGFLETIKDTAVSIKDFLLNLGEVIGNVLSDLFVPSEEALDFSGVKAILLEKFPFDLFSQISDTFDVSLPSEGLSYNLDVFGSTMTLDFASFSSYFPFSLRSVVLAVFYLTLIVSVLRMLIPGLKI